MKHTTKILLILALVATAGISVPGPSHAGKSVVARSPELRAGAVGGPTQESWWGAAARYGCRQGFRYIGTPAFAAYSSFCILALLDAIIS
jgi:hypothetical protein